MHAVEPEAEDRQFNEPIDLVLRGGVLLAGFHSIAVNVEHRTINAQVEKLTQNIKLIEEELQDYEKLSNNKSKGVSKHQYNQKRQDHINAKHELASQESRLIEINEGKIQLEKARQYTEYQLKQETLNGLREAQELIPQYLADSQRAKHRMDQAHIKAPANGTVQQLNIHTEGRVVSPW